MNKLPTQEYLQECFKYDSQTGLLYWKERPEHHFKTFRGFRMWNARFSGKLALNYVDKINEYLCGTLDGKSVQCHRVIYKLVHGTEPDLVLHENGKRTDNRIDKLSVGTHNKNMLDQKKPKNNLSGVMGVCKDNRSGKWRASIRGKGKQKHLGYFENFQDAVDARKQAELEYGYHPNHGKR